MGLLNSIKNDVKKSGQNKGKFIYFREGQKIRIRFLQDMDDGIEIQWHDSFERGVNVPCQEAFGRECEYCDDDTLRTRNQYCWSVWNYEANEVQLFMFAVNNCSPIPALVSMYEEYGTLMDRDYVISVQGKQQNKTFSVVPMDKVKFRNEKAKPFASKTVLKMIDKAWPDENGNSSDEDEEEETPKRRNNKKPVNKSKSKSAKEEEEDDYDNDSFEEDEKQDYSDMSSVELFKLCKERGIEAAKRKPEKYYIKLLEENDKAHDDWDDEGSDSEDDWEDDEDLPFN